MNRYPALLVCLLLSGCAPEYIHDAPEFQGQLLADGVPVVNANFEVSAIYSKERAPGTTDSEGRFKTPGLGHFAMQSLLGDAIYGYKLEFEIDGRRYIGFDSGMRPGYAPGHLDVTCELSRPIRQVMGGTMICSSKKGY